MAKICISDGLITSTDEFSFCAGSNRFRMRNSAHSNSPTEIPHLSASSLVVAGDLTVHGSCSILNTTVCTTSAMSITNAGTGPALVVNQTGSQPIINIQDDGTSVLYIEDGGNVGLGGVTNPEHKLQVWGNIGVGTTYNGGVYANSSMANVDENWGFDFSYTTGQNDYSTRLKYYPVNGHTRKGGIYNSSDDSWVLYGDSNTTPNVIVPSGCVGIGLTNPNTKLHVAGPTRSCCFMASNGSDYDKFNVYGSGSYSIGMVSAITYGALNDWAMTFRMNNDADRGFWWGDDAHTKAQGAMSLTTGGIANIASSLKIGGGVSDTSGPSETLSLYCSSSTSATTTGTTLIGLTNYVGSDIQQQKTFIDFTFTDDNTNEIPQVRIGAEVGPNSDANSQEKEGEGAFVIYTNNATQTSGAATGLCERMRVDYTGNVGIGTSSPESNLQIGTLTSTSTATPKVLSLGGTYSNCAGSNPKIRLWDSCSTSYMGFGISSSTLEYILTQTNWKHVFYAAGSPLMTILGTGNVGIGTSDPTSKLDIRNTSCNTASLFVQNSGGTGSNSIGCGALLAKFCGNSDSLEIRNIDDGDYSISNPQQNNGIVFYDGTGGVRIFYNGACKLNVDSNGITTCCGIFNCCKYTGVGDICSCSDIVAGIGGGGVALTINDGYGNANVTFNHKCGVPEQNGNSGRIEVNTDGSGNACMAFELASNVTSGSAVQTGSILTLCSSSIIMHQTTCMCGCVVATKLVDTNNTACCVDPAGTSYLNCLYLNGNAHRFQVGHTCNTSTADTIGLHLYGNYTSGQYAHRLRKYDHGGGVPLYIDSSGGTANVFSACARFGTYTGNSNAFEVFGNSGVTGQLCITSSSNTAGNIKFSAASPYICASSYIVMPGGLYVSGGTAYFSNGTKHRGGVGNDSQAWLCITGGTAGDTSFGGNVGIGTTDPAYMLQVHCSSDIWHASFGGNGGSQLRIGGATGSGAVIGAYGNNTNSCNRDLYLQRDGGNVGIGTNNPGGYKLCVNGCFRVASTSHFYNHAYLNGYNISGVNNLYINDPGANEGINWSSTSGNWIIDVSPLDRSNADGNLNLYNSSSNNIALWRPQLWVYDASNYATGTANSDGSLTITSTNTGDTIFSVDGSNGTLFSVVDDLSDSLMSVNDAAGLPVLEVFADSSVCAGRYSCSDFYIASGGNVGIGTTDPYSRFQVGDTEQTTQSELTIASRYDGGGPILNFRVGHPSNAYTWNVARICATDNGNYNGRLDFQTTVSNGYNGTQPTTRLRINSTGDICATCDFCAYQYCGHSNIDGTGYAARFPCGFYASGTSWLYGSTWMNNNSILDLNEVDFVDQVKFCGTGNANELVLCGANATNIELMLSTAGTVRGYLHANNSNEVGLLDSGGSWGIKHVNDVGTYFYDNGATFRMCIGSGTTCTCNRIDILNNDSGATGASAPDYYNAQIEIATTSNYTPAISFHRGGYSATTLHEYDGELYVSPWTTRTQAGKLISTGNLLTCIQAVDGGGSGLDADTLDGLQAASFLRADAVDSSYCKLSFRYDVSNIDSVGGSIGVTPFNGTFQATNRPSSGGNYTTGLEFTYYDQGARTQLAAASTGSNNTGELWVRSECWGTSAWTSWWKIWHSGNDGGGSGLDADTLDGQQGSYYSNYNCLSNKPTIPTNNNQLTNGCGYITSYTDTNYYLNGITKSGNTLTFSVNGTTNQSYTFGSNAFNSTTIPTNTNQLTNGAGYTTCTGDITNVSAGTGLSGGGSSGSVTLSLANTTVTAGTYSNSNITVDAQGRITSASSGSGGSTPSNCQISFNYGACICGYVNPDSFELNQSYNESFCFAHRTGGAGSGNYGGGINCISLDSYGHVTSITTGCSDYRVKTNVQPYTIGYEAVKCVDTYQYILIDDEDKKCHAGMMAHELQEAGIFHGPYGVKDEVNEEGEPVYQTVNYSELVPTLWSAVKTLIAKVEQLEETNNTLIDRITKLEQAIGI